MTEQGNPNNPFAFQPGQEQGQEPPVVGESDPQPAVAPEPAIAPERPVSPEVQAQRDREARADDDRRATEEAAQQELRDREAKEADQQLSDETRVRVALNERVDVGDEAVFLASTGHNTDDDA